MIRDSYLDGKFYGRAYTVVCVGSICVSIVGGALQSGVWGQIARLFPQVFWVRGLHVPLKGKASDIDLLHRFAASFAACAQVIF